MIPMANTVYVAFWDLFTMICDRFTSKICHHIALYEINVFNNVS